MFFIVVSSWQIRSRGFIFYTELSHEYPEIKTGDRRLVIMWMKSCNPLKPAIPTYVNRNDIVCIPKLLKKLRAIA